MAAVDIAKAPETQAVLPFFAAGAAFFLMMAVLLIVAAADMQGFYLQPHMLAIVHSAAIGWGTMVIFGASYQLLPVICGKDLYSSRLAFVSFWFLLTGAAGLVAAFWRFKTGCLMIGSGGAVFIAVVLYGINVWKTTGHCRQYSIQKCFILSSACWLLFTVTAGLLMAANLVHPFLKRDQLEMVKLHAHAGIAGWFLQLITGVSSKLVPMFLLGKARSLKKLYYSFVLQNAGLLSFEVDGYFNGMTVRSAFYLLLVCAGIAWYGLYLYDVFKNRVRRKLDIQMKQTFSSFAFLALALFCLPVIYLKQRGPWTMVYGSLLFMGWLSAIILGMTFKTLPFIVWNDLYKEVNGKIKVPLPKQLYSNALLRYQLILFGSALLLLQVGLITGQLLVIRSALWVWLGTAVVYVLNTGKILLHKVKMTRNGHTAK